MNILKHTKPTIMDITTLFGSSDKLTATVIVMGNGRFFSRFGKKKRVLTAHTLAGAKLFQDEQSAKAITDKLGLIGKFFLLSQISFFDNFIHQKIEEHPVEAEEMESKLNSSIIDGEWFSNTLITKRAIFGDENLPF